MNIFKKILFDRLFFLFSVYLLVFILTGYKLYNLQIINGDKYTEIVEATTIKNISINAPRGDIFDKYGVPLAINKTTFNIKIDPSISLDDNELNKTLYRTILLLEKNEYTIKYDIPISLNSPYDFKNSSVSLRFIKDLSLFSKPPNFSNDEYNNFIKQFTKDEIFNSLFSKFRIDKDYPLEYKLKIASLRYSMYLQMFSKFNPITIAYGVSQEIVSVIEEQKDYFQNIFISVEQSRNYPLGTPLAHLIGYTGVISESELNNFKDKNITYSINDIIGKASLEQYYELDLKGEPGKSQITVTPFGKRVESVTLSDPIKGNNLFLTLDSELQVKSYEFLEEVLTEVIVNKITKKNERETPITMEEFFPKIVSGSNIDYNKIINAEEGTVSYDINELLKSKKNAQIEKLKETITDEKKLNDRINRISFFDILPQSVKNGDISHSNILLLLIEQGIITANDTLYEKIEKGYISPLSVVVSKLKSGEITPQMTNLDPSTGSVVVVDVNNGNILTAVSYPSYDNNFFTNLIDDSYLNKIYNDPSSPSLYRAFNERRAPGSTFKMITAVAGLEENYINPTTTIYDNIIFTKAGSPHAKCWSSVSHGHLDASTALQVSCNYFFYETAYMMGNSKSGNSDTGISILNDYMIKFGLNDGTGSEINEFADQSNFEYIISSPQYKADLARSAYLEPTNSQLSWYDGDTIRTAIGQSTNNYSTATMAKYIATLVNGGNRYSLHFLDEIVNTDGDLVDVYEPNLEYSLNLKSSTIDEVLHGMYLVTNGSRGTARSFFYDFPITIGGKTGTSEQEVANRASHTSFSAFAPFDNPEIAIYVMIPYGTTYTMGSPSVTVAKKVLETYFGFNVDGTYKDKINSFTQ